MKHLSKVLLLAAMPVFAQAGEITDNYELPRALEECHIYNVEGKGFFGGRLIITVCPEAAVTTTYKVGKTTQQTTTLPTN